MPSSEPCLPVPRPYRLQQQIPERRAHCAPCTIPPHPSILKVRRDEVRAVYRPLRMVEICRRAVAQATGFTFPESNSCMRRAISSCQAASAPSSTVSSRLSRSEPASAARAAAGSASAFFSSSEISSLITAFYLRAAAERRDLGKQKFFGPQVLDRVPQLGRFLKLKSLGRLAHVAFQLHNVSVQIFLRLELRNSVRFDRRQVRIIGCHNRGQRHLQRTHNRFWCDAIGF